jgi:hypothetical protein
MFDCESVELLTARIGIFASRRRLKEHAGGLHCA